MNLNELSQYYYLNKEIERDKNRIIEQRAKVKKESSSMSKSQLEDIEKAIADTEELIRLNIQKRYYEEKKARDYIESIQNSRLRLAFKLRFIDCLSWNKVADGLGGNNTEDSARKAVTRYIKRKSCPICPLL